MKSFLLSSKIFYKNTFLVIACCLFFGYVNYDFIRIFAGVSAYKQTAFVFLSETLKISIFCTIFFMFLSYEFFLRAKSSHFEECLSSTKGGRFKLLANHFLLIVVLIMVITVTAVIYNLAYPNTNIHNFEYILHMLSSVFIYIFIVPVSGALIGMCVSLVVKRMLAYLIMIAFILLSSPLSSIIAFTVSDATMFKINISPVFDIFNLYPINLDFAPIYNFGISLLPYKLEAILFWLFAAIAIVLIKISKKSQHALRIASLLCAIVSLINLVAFFQPSSKVDMSDRVDGTLFSDQFYYSSLYKEQYPDEKPAEFQVLSYDLDMNVENQLYMKAKLKVDKTNLPIYKFTLYHNYKIKKITNQDNVSLQFKQDADHVEIYSNQSLSEINFTYSGYNTRFYTNNQGIFLPGYFAYYPIAGYKNIYSPDYQYYAKMLLPNETNFTIKINSKKRIFTNIEPNSTGGYSGKTNGLTIMSGFLKSTVISDIEIIYPHFNTQEFSDTQLRRDIDNFLKIKKDDNVKKIFVVPGVNQKSDSIVAYSDYLTAEQIIALPDRYIYTKMLDKKQMLYMYQDMYLNNRDNFNESVNAEATFPPEFDRICTIYQEKVNSLGEETVIEKTNKYIFDNNDTRSIIEFLNQLN